MEDVFHSGSGTYGFKTIFKNGDTNYDWYKTESERDSAYKKAKSKMTNKVSVNKCIK